MIGDPSGGINHPNVNGFFDDVAESYSHENRPVPPKFVDLLCDKLSLDSRAKVVELGCGTGGLSLALAARGMQVTAVDSSSRMLQLAKRHPNYGSVKWIHAMAEGLDLSSANYDAIISFEAFHLFSANPRFISDIYRILRPGGLLCVSWTTGEWEDVCRSAVAAAFAGYGSNMTDWGYWTCPNLDAQLLDSRANWTPIRRADVDVATTSSPATIVEFLLSIDRVSQIPDSLHGAFRDELYSNVSALANPDGVFSGLSRYSLKYTSKSAIGQI